VIFRPMAVAVCGYGLPRGGDVGPIGVDHGIAGRTGRPRTRRDHPTEIATTPTRACITKRP
jgi:hypothetical protein